MSGLIEAVLHPEANTAEHRLAGKRQQLQQWEPSGHLPHLQEGGVLVVCHAGATHEGGPPPPAVLLVHLYHPLLDLQKGRVRGRWWGSEHGQD